MEIAIEKQLTTKLISNNEPNIKQFLELHHSEDVRSVCHTWKLLVNESEINIINDRLAKYINEKFAKQNIVIVAMLKGSVYFFVDLTRRLTIPYSTYFIETSIYNDSLNQSSEINLDTKIIPSKFINKKIILLDELYNNGVTLAKTKEKIVELTNIDPHDIFTCVMFKKQKITDQPQPDLCGLEIPDIWICGYGIDDWQEKRGWTHLFAVPKTDEIQHTNDDRLFINDEYYELKRKEIKNQIFN